MNASLPGLKEMSEVIDNDGTSIAIYGPAGIGKTLLSLSFPAKKRFIMSFEPGGLKVAKHLPGTVYIPSQYVEVQRAVEWLEKDTEHDTVVVDSLTELGRLVQTQSITTGARSHPELTNQQDFYLTVERMRNLIRRIRLLIQKGKTVIFTCAETVDKDAVTGRMIGGPDLPGNKLGAELCYLVDELYRMVAGSGTELGQRFIVTQPDTMYVAKSRVPSAPIKIHVPKDKPETAFTHITKGH